MWPAVPTIMFFVMFDMERSADRIVFRCYCWMLRKTAERVKSRVRKCLFRGSNFIDDGLRCCARIFGGNDRPADHNVIGAGFDGLSGRREARLIVLFSGGFCRGTNAR